MHAGCAGVAGAHGAHSAAGWGAQAAAARSAQASGCWARRRVAGAWQGSGRRAGRAAYARRLGQLGQVGVLFTLTQFLDPVRLGIFFFLSH